MSLLELAERATQADGVAPFNEASLFALQARERARVIVHQSDAEGRIVAAAYAVGDAPVEIVVDPESRRAGVGRRMLDELVADGEHHFWAHGDLPAAQALAAAAGLTAERTLLVLRLTFDGPPPAEAPPWPVGVDRASSRPPHALRLPRPLRPGPCALPSEPGPTEQLTGIAEAPGVVGAIAAPRVPQLPLIASARALPPPS